MGGEVAAEPEAGEANPHMKEKDVSQIYSLFLMQICIEKT